MSVGRLAIIGVLFTHGAMSQTPSMPVGQTVGVGVPSGNCVVGQFYFRVDAVAGANVYVCTALPGTWTVVGGTVGAAGERYSWLLCAGVDCAVGTNAANAVLVARTVTVTACYAKAGIAPTGADLNIVIKRTGASNIFATDLTITAGSTAVVTETGMSASAALTAGQYLTLDITQVGSSVPGQNVSVTCIGN